MIELQEINVIEKYVETSGRRFTEIIKSCKIRGVGVLEIGRKMIEIMKDTMQEIKEQNRKVEE